MTIRRFSLQLFIALAAAAVAFIVLTSRALPERVASHFGPGGHANGWMTREAYLIVVLAAATLLPLVIVALVAALPRAFPRGINLPNRDYWLAPERRDATLGALAGFAWAFACLLTLFVAGMHWTIVDAHASAPPQLAEAAVHLLMAGFVAAVAAWIITLYLRFRRTG
ncbi:MAG TPA: DUF1648 domain-containing protein [Casimicrobiaceae bacterium]|jgi:uncharacterized membrane protein|nr:DUF1648 domain-containing protein [Casimicrobiaceae bacterium]